MSQTKMNNIKRFDTVKEHRNYYGKLFGYPQCCIDSFCLDKRQREPIRTIASKKTGFIPCMKQAEQITNGEITLESLITNRLHSKPFPEDY